MTTEDITAQLMAMRESLLPELHAAQIELEPVRKMLQEKRERYNAVLWQIGTLDTAIEALTGSKPEGNYGNA